MAETMTQAASSTATETPLNPQEVLNGMSKEQRKEWQLSGKIPDQPNKADSAPAKESSEASQAESAPAPEAGKTQEKPKRDNAESRIKELLAKVKALETEKAAREAPKETKADPSPAKAEPPKAPTKLEEPNEPDQKDFKSYEEYDTAHKKWVRDLAKYEAAKAVEADRQERIQQFQKEQREGEMKSARERYGETFDATIRPALEAISPNPKIPPIIKELLGSHEYAFDVMYVLGLDPAKLAAFVKNAEYDPNNPGKTLQAIEEAVLLKKLVIDDLAKKKSSATETPERGTDGKFLPKESSPEKTVTTAKRPPVEVGGKGTAPADAAEAAIKRSDFKAYEAEMNRREIAARKG